MLTKCSFIIHSNLLTLLRIVAYVLCRVLNLACIDSAPCSPIIPKPTPCAQIQSYVWSSSKCIFTGTVAVGNVERKKSMKLLMACPVIEKNDVY